jgi:hypothetical protein
LNDAETVREKAYEQCSGSIKFLIRIRILGSVHRVTDTVLDPAPDSVPALFICGFHDGDAYKKFSFLRMF